MRLASRALYLGSLQEGEISGVRIPAANALLHFSTKNLVRFTRFRGDAGRLDLRGGRRTAGFHLFLGCFKQRG